MNWLNRIFSKEAKLERRKELIKKSEVNGYELLYQIGPQMVSGFPTFNHGIQYLFDIQSRINQFMNDFTLFDLGKSEKSLESSFYEEEIKRSDFAFMHLGETLKEDFDEASLHEKDGLKSRQAYASLANNLSKLDKFLQENASFKYPEGSSFFNATKLIENKISRTILANYKTPVEKIIYSRNTYGYNKTESIKESDNTLITIIIILRRLQKWMMLNLKTIDIQVPDILETPDTDEVFIQKLDELNHEIGKQTLKGKSLSESPKPEDTIGFRGFPNEKLFNLFLDSRKVASKTIVVCKDIINKRKSVSEEELDRIIYWMVHKVEEIDYELARISKKTSKQFPISISLLLKNIRCVKSIEGEVRKHFSLNK